MTKYTLCNCLSQDISCKYTLQHKTKHFVGIANCAALFTFIFENAGNSICCLVNFGTKRNMLGFALSQFHTPFQYISTILLCCPRENHDSLIYSLHFLVSEGGGVE